MEERRGVLKREFEIYRMHSGPDNEITNLSCIDMTCRILVWEGGFCNFSACATGLGNDGRPGSLCFQGRQQPQGSDEPCEAMSPELFFKMSHEVYNYGEGYCLLFLHHTIHALETFS